VLHKNYAKISVEKSKHCFYVIVYQIVMTFFPTLLLGMFFVKTLQKLKGGYKK